MKRLALLAVMLPVVLLQGCWDMKEAQNINFITALGVDYEEDHYVVYAQIIDFPNIAKREGGTDNKNNSSAWVGKGEGESVLLALNDVYDSSQQQTMWTHVKAIILSERVMKSKMDDLFSSLLRSREMRYVPWVYGTSCSIPDLLSSITILNLSAQTTEMFEPVAIYKQRSDVEPIHLQRLMNGIREPGAVVLLPSISNYNDVWMIKGKHPPLIRTDGVYVISKNTSQGYAAEDKILGARYIKFRDVYHYPVSLKLEDGGHAMLSMTHPRSDLSIKPEFGNLEVSMVIQSKASITEVYNLHKGITESMLHSLAEAKVKEQVRQAFEYSQKGQMDLFGLEEYMYRRHYSLWKQYADAKRPMLPDFKLKSADVRINIIHGNAYNLKH